VERVRRQQNLLLILAKSFAAQLATAVFLVDAEGTVIYFNEAAERLLGQPFIEGAGMAAEEWSTRYRPRDSEGHTVPLESLPLGVTMLKRKPAYGILTILGADGVDRRIEVAAVPLFARAADFVGAIALFWERPEDRETGEDLGQPRVDRVHLGTAAIVEGENLPIPRRRAFESGSTEGRSSPSC
jgi:PAS domain-containing protein